MTRPRPRLGRASLAAAATLLAISTLSTIPTIASPATATTGTITPGPTPPDVRTLGDPVAGPRDVDTRGKALPTALQRAAVSDIGGVTARWNALGTPASILPAGGTLGDAPGTPEEAARDWLGDHAAAFGMSPDAVGDLVLVSSQRLADSDARAVLLRQDFGGVAPAL